MVSNTFFTAAIVLAASSRVSAHVSIWDPSMWGFNNSQAPHRAQDPLMDMTFEEWWWHGLLDVPPHPEDIMQLPVGGTVTTELSCDKGATSFWESAPGGDTRDPNNWNNPCPHAPMAAYHTNGINDLGGCALAVAYKSDPFSVKPEDFTVFSINQTCVWYRFTDFQIPKMMPKCPNGLCMCAWFWMHRPDSGSEQIYFTPFQCNMQGATSTKPLPPAQVPRRCGVDPDLNRPAHPWNCTYGPKQPFYWDQLEGNNMFEGTFQAPRYDDLYNFPDGPQNDIFEPGSYNNASNLTSSSAMPTSSNAMPTSSNAMPTSSNAMLTSSNAMPTSSNAMPTSSNAMPTSSPPPSPMPVEMAQYVKPSPSPAESTPKCKPKQLSSERAASVERHKPAPPHHHQPAPPPHHQQDDHHRQDNHHHHEPRIGEEPVHRDLAEHHRRILRRKRNF